MRTIRLAGTHLLCKGETESEPYANGESDINPDTLTDAHTDPVAVTHTDADTDAHTDAVAVTHTDTDTDTDTER
jgi:hypothetical protein